MGATKGHNRPVYIDRCDHLPHYLKSASFVYREKIRVFVLSTSIRTSRGNPGAGQRKLNIVCEQVVVDLGRFPDYGR